MILRRDTPASRPLPTWVIIASAGTALALMVAAIWLSVVAPRGVPGIKYSYLNAQFADAANVPNASEVRIAGRRAGQVTRTTLRAGRATLRLQLLPGNGPLRSDTRARIRLKGLLGGKYVELTPGGSGALLPDDATLPVAQTSTAEDVLDVIQALDAPARADLQRMVRGLGAGLASRGEGVNRMLSVAPGAFRDFGRVSDAVLARPGAAARLVPSVESTVAALDPVRGELARGLRPQAMVLETLADARRDVERTLDLAPSTLAALRGGMTAATPLLHEAAGLARAAVRFTRPAPAALRDTAALLRDAPPALRATTPLLRSIDAAVPPTLLLLRRVDPVTAPATRALRDGRPPLAELGRRPCELLDFARNWRSMLAFGVAPGAGDPTGDLDQDVGLGQLNSLRIVATSPAPPESLAIGPAPTLPASNPYPAPCQASKDRQR